MAQILQFFIRLWLSITGKTVDFERYPFLRGPMASGEVIGDAFYEQVADAENLTINNSNDRGLLPDFSKVVDSSATVLPEVTDFYERTARYKMEVWPQWKAPVSWFAKALIRLVSQDIQQLNIPMDAMETSYGMSSEVIQLLTPEQHVKYTCWLRKSVQSKRVVYAGFYSSCKLTPEDQVEYVRVIFPLPKGNVTVILRVDVQADGSVKLVSSGGRWGGTGYYRMHQLSSGKVKARMIPIKEVIHVFKDEAGTLRTDHSFAWWSLKFLQLHYKMNEVK